MRKHIKTAITEILAVIACAVLALPSCCIKAGAAKTSSATYNVEQAQGNAPVIKAYINGRNISKKSDIRAKVSGSDFKEDLMFGMENIEKFSSSGEGIHYIILFDNSMSVDEEQFKQAKKELVKMGKGLGGKDKMDLYTVGSDSPSGIKKYIAGSKKKKSMKEQVKAIKDIKRDKTKTVLYRSLTELLLTVDNSSMRTVILLVTDGEDDSQGKNNKSYEVNPAVKSSRIPVYGLLLKNSVRHPDKDKIKNTKKNILNERNSRGYYEECLSTKDVTKGFNNIKNILYNETYIVTLRQEDGTNRTTTDASLLMVCGNKEVKLSGGTFTYNNIGETDTDPPVVKDIKKTGNNSIQFNIRDNKTKYIHGAEEAGNYIVKDENGKDWEVDKVNATKGDYNYELVFKDKLYTGKYILTCSNITDDSQEKNYINKPVEFEFDGLDERAENLKAIAKNYWWAAGLVIIALITGVVLIILVKRKPARVEIEEKYADPFGTSSSKLLGITITDNNGVVSESEWNVEGSIFVGRLDICDVYFDDEMLSKQHFVVEVTKAGCYIEDLDTTNGTYVNGVKMTGKRRISDGDIVTAGCEKFIFHTLGSEVK